MTAAALSPHRRQPSLGHVVHFYQEVAPFLNELSRFIGAALAAGDSAIVIATKEHSDHLASLLKERGVDLSRAGGKGCYRAVDARQLLAELMSNGRLESRRFHALLGDLITTARAASAGGRQGGVAIFGEMVALLWAQGKTDAALELERLWNELAKTHFCSLRCAYPISGFNSVQDAESFRKICDAHTAVIPDDSFTSLSGEQERLRKVAQLQQAAQPVEELSRLNEQLRQSEERFRSLVESVKDYAIFMLDSKGHILSWNIGAERIKGYRPEEIIGKHFSTFYTPEDIRAGRPERGLRIAKEEGRYEDEGWRVRKDGSRFFADVVITPMFDRNGELQGYSKVTRDVTERRRAEEAVRQLSGRLLRAQDEERRRLARELHDSTAQTLTALGINIALLNEHVDATLSPKTARVLAESTELVEQASREIRSVSYLLHPPMLELAGLRSAGRWYVDGFAQRTNLQVELEIDPRLGRLPRDVEIALFRTLQESLTNVYRHSGSATAKVRVTVDGRAVTLEISDQGQGFSPDKLVHGNLSPAMLGVGISGMRERIRQLGGNLEITSGPAGVTVRANVSLGEGEAARTATD